MGGRPDRRLLVFSAFFAFPRRPSPASSGSQNRPHSAPLRRLEHECHSGQRFGS